ncbi:hypothetical protein [Cupriavidus necator]
MRDTTVPTLDYCKLHERAKRRDALAELNAEASRLLDGLRKDYEAKHGAKVMSLLRGPAFVQSAFDGAEKLPEAFLDLLLYGHGTGKMPVAERHALLLPLALRAIGADAGEPVPVTIWHRKQYDKRAERMRKRVASYGYAVSDKDKTLGHFLRCIQRGRVKAGPEADGAAPHWADLRTLWFRGERIRVTWRGDYPQCTATKGSLWRLLGEYADTRAKQAELVRLARKRQAELDEAAALDAKQTERREQAEALDLFETADTGVTTDKD